MRAYALAGQRHEALRQFRQLSEALRQELDLEPDAATQKLHKDIAAGRFPSEDTPLRVKEPAQEGEQPPRLHNLPLQLTTFVGRLKEADEVKSLLSSTRLLTLTGPGGCGKTRLAIEVASGLVGNYRDGVWLVELASLSEPPFVAQAVASVLRAQEQPGRTLTETLVTLLQAKDALLMLDNCEHLIDACAELAERLLRGCKTLRIVATSREPLNIPGESAWPVPSLSLPERGNIYSVEKLGEYEATRLFIDRAARSLPGFSPTERDAPVIGQICRQLDGMPLAIELAAARIKVLSLDQIAEMLTLNNPFRLLAGGSRTASPRHQTLRAAIDWSYGLLSAKEQALFRRLSVFAGGFTLASAEAVCGADDGRQTTDDGHPLDKDRRTPDQSLTQYAPRNTDELRIPESEVLDLLSRLVDKSLVLVPLREEGPAQHAPRNTKARYRLLETTGGSVLRTAVKSNRPSSGTPGTTARSPRRQSRRCEGRGR